MIFQGDVAAKYRILLKDDVETAARLHDHRERGHCRNCTSRRASVTIRTSSRNLDSSGIE
jgi:hypothetical protein